jgi:hypothetical protein
MNDLMRRSIVAMVLFLIAGPAVAQNDTTIHMKTPPNKTVVTGRLQKFESAVDGYGGDLEIEVVSNESPDPSADFIKPEAGKQLRAFYPGPSERDISSLIGGLVRVDLTFLGGPSGGRAVVQSLRAVSPPR